VRKVAPGSHLLSYLFDIPCIRREMREYLLKFEIYLLISDAYGGRTRARTWDPLIKSQRLKMLGIGPNQQ
jgi:hypothetical protein